MFWTVPQWPRHTQLMTQLEFWPDYGAGPLWTQDGQVADLAQLGLPGGLSSQLLSWNERYAEDKIPLDGDGDADWLAEGRELLARTRAAWRVEHHILVTEPWWGERN